MSKTTTQQVVWYRAVGFGTPNLPQLVSRDWGKVAVALSDARREDASGYTAANSRIYGYATQQQAKEGDISDDIGKNGRIE